MANGSQDSFVHLHVHTEYSMLDGASLLDGLFTRVADQEMPAIAMTDHGNLHGAYDFYSKARKYGVKRSSASRPTSPRARRAGSASGSAGARATRPRRAARTSRAAAPTPT